MPNSRPSVTTAADTTNFDTSPRESGDDSEDESEILEESPCGRWLKRREEVDQRDVPGINCVHLAMDTEEGVEVVWNEVQYSDPSDFKNHEEKMRQVFENLLQLDHQNIVKFHRYWTDIQSDKPRVIFITEYMSSGSLKQFLKRTKRNAKRLPLEAWRRWCTQILSALSYLHSCTPPVIHGNLTCDTIFIQHNGLVKIGSVVPDAIHYNVKICKENSESMHMIAPEYGRVSAAALLSPKKLTAELTQAVDIYAFGMCALEMAALEIQSSSDTSLINEETILRTINSLEHELQRDLIFKCLKRNPDERPSAHELLFHPLLFEVHSLKLLSAHCLVFMPKNRTQFSETIIDEMMQRYNRPEVILAKITKQLSEEEICYRLSDVPSADKLEKFVEDVKFGVYPLTAFAGKKPPHFRIRAVSPEAADSVKSVTPEPVDVESRRIVNMMCSVKAKEDSNDLAMTILLRMDDKMNRQLTCQVTEDDSASVLTSELVRLGFVHVDDQEKIGALLEDTLRGSFSNQQHQHLQLQGQHLQHQTLDISALNESSSDSVKTMPVSQIAFTERNWSVADTESPSNPNAAMFVGESAALSSESAVTAIISSSNSNSSSISNSSQHHHHHHHHHQQQQQQQQQQNENISNMTVSITPQSQSHSSKSKSKVSINKQMPTTKTTTITDSNKDEVDDSDNSNSIEMQYELHRQHQN